MKDERNLLLTDLNSFALLLINLHKKGPQNEAPFCFDYCGSNTWSILCNTPFK
jgi:hypothetical protein